MTASLGNFQNGAFGSNLDGYVYPQFLFNPLRAPTTNDIYPAGTQWLDNSVTPKVIYETTGAGVWVSNSGLVSPTDVTAGASPRVANNRYFKVVFSGVSIGAGLDQTLTITNSTITSASTDIMLSWSGTTSGSALSLKSVVPGAGTVALTFTNGTGATLSNANITVVGWVMS